MTAAWSIAFVLADAMFGANTTEPGRTTL